MPPSRALGTKSGDQQARTELLGKLLNAAGEPAYFLTHGTDRTSTCLILVRATDEEVKQWADTLKPAPQAIRMGPLQLVPLPLERGAALGTVDAKLYDPQNGWTATVAVMRFR